MVEGFRWPLELAAGCGFWRGTTLVTTARFAGASLAPLLGCGGVVFCCVRCLRGGGASARYVQMLLLLI